MNKGRKVTGGKYHKERKKRLYEKQNQERLVSIGETKKKKLRGMGGKIILFLLEMLIKNFQIYLGL